MKRTGKRANQSKTKRNKIEKSEVTADRITLEESKATLLKNFDEIG